MQGKHEGVVTELKRKIVAARASGVPTTEGIIRIHCVCHRFALILHDVISKKFIPVDVINILKELYEYFCKSGARKRDLKSFVHEENLQRLHADIEDTVINPDEELERII